MSKIKKKLNESHNFSQLQKPTPLIILFANKTQSMYACMYVSITISHHTASAMTIKQRWPRKKLCKPIKKPVTCQSIYVQVEIFFSSFFLKRSSTLITFQSNKSVLFSKSHIVLSYIFESFNRWFFKFPICMLSMEIITNLHEHKNPFVRPTESVGTVRKPRSTA